MTPGYSHMMPYYSPMGDGRDHMSDRNLSMDEICGRFRNYISRNPHFPDVSTLAYEIRKHISKHFSLIKTITV